MIAARFAVWIGKTPVAPRAYEATRGTARRASSPVAWGTLGLMLVWLMPAYAERYLDISGELHVTETLSRPSQGSASAHENRWSVKFQCTVGRNAWQLVGNFAQNARIKWFFDGTNVYCSHEITSAVPPNVINALSNAQSFAVVPFDRAKSNLTIYVVPSSEGHPLDDVSVNIPWLAFCSGSYLKRPGRLIPLPTAEINHAADAFAYVDTLQTFDDELGLPHTLDLYCSEELFPGSVTNYFKSKALDVAEWRREFPWFRNGVHKFHFEVTQSTNLAGWHVPLTFTFVDRVAREYRSRDSSRSYAGNGRVFWVTNSSGPEGVFVAGQQQTIVDRRFQFAPKRINALIYRSSNAFLMPTNEGTLQQQFAAAVQRAKWPKRVAAVRVRWVILAIILVSAALPVAVLRLWRRNDGKPKI